MHRPRGNTRSKRGQAALEYIVTYGWGFVVILVVLGALAYFGYLNPSRYVPARCSFGVQLDCTDYRLTNASGNCNGKAAIGFVTVELHNNFAADINISSIQTASLISKNSTAYTILKGQKSITSLCITADDVDFMLVPGERSTVPLIITFQRNATGATPLHNVTGEVFATVQRK